MRRLTCARSLARRLAQIGWKAPLGRWSTMVCCRKEVGGVAAGVAAGVPLPGEVERGADGENAGGARVGG